MKPNKSLKHNLILHMVVMVTVVSALFSTGLLMLKQRLEEATFGEMVRKHMETVMTHPDSTASLQGELFDEWLVYRGSEARQLPMSIQQMSEGSHHSVAINDHIYHVNIAQTEEGRIYLLYNITRWEEQEHFLLDVLLYGILAVLIAAIFIGQRVANIILAPVQALTNRLGCISPDERNLRIGPDFTGTEIGLIALAFDQYAARLDQFVERERSFTAAASHELRTPLSVMLGAIDILETTPLNATGERALARVRRACAEMTAFIEATLFLSREDNKSIQTITQRPLADVIKDIVEDNSPAIIESNIDIKLTLTSELQLDVPDSIIKIALNNLLRNAIEHTQGGEISVTLSGSKLVLRDTGEGIPREHLPHIYDRSYSTKASGIGMGLNLVKRICDRFGWTLVIDSEPGQGTEVMIEFCPES